MPSGTSKRSLTFSKTLVTKPGREPPLVSHSTSQSAPAETAASRTAIAYSGLFAYPSKKCSASKTTSRPLALRNDTLSLTSSRFSSSDIFSALITWKSQLLPNIATHSAPDPRMVLRLESSAAVVPARRVLPKAVSLACSSFSAEAASKNAASLGFEPGQPPSM